MSMTVALCFLTIGDVTQPALWSSFLAGAQDARIYCHPKDRDAISSEFLCGRIIGNLVPTQHGTASLVDASLNLFQAAYEDPSNEHFILLSDTAIPIIRFADIASELAGNKGKSLISFMVPPPGSEHFARQSSLPPSCVFDPFFKHDQWVILSRNHVQMLLGKPKLDCFARMFAADEHYFLNVLAHVCGVLPKDVLNRRKTFVNWAERVVTEKKDASGSLLSRTIHPKTYTALSSSDVLQARGAGYWFFRKVSRDCDCSALANFVV
jgi:hypothetical protein